MAEFMAFEMKLINLEDACWDRSVKLKSNKRLHKTKKKDKIKFRNT